MLIAVTVPHNIWKCRIDREAKPTIPPQVSYRLTDRHRELSQPLYHLYDLAVRWYGDDRDIANSEFGSKSSPSLNK